MNINDTDKYFSTLIETGLTPSVSVCCADRGKIKYLYAEGTEKAGDGTKKVTEDTLFNIASVSKIVTILVTLKLAENGQLTLTDKVNRYIPEYPFDDVLICHLLTHTAGYYEFEMLDRPLTADKRNDYIKSVYNVTERRYKVGEKAAYWTCDYTIVMDIIERITGKGLETLAREWIFEPLDMPHTTYFQHDLSSKSLVRPWYEETKSFLCDICAPVVTGDAGIWTTAKEYVHIGQMLLNLGEYKGRRVLSRPTVEFLMNEKGGKFKSSAGLWIRGDEDTFGCFGDLSSLKTAGHTGMTGCMLFADPVNDLTAVILTNSIKLHTDWNNYKKICNVLESLDS